MYILIPLFTLMSIARILIYQGRLSLKALLTIAKTDMFVHRPFKSCTRSYSAGQLPMVAVFNRL